MAPIITAYRDVLYGDGTVAHGVPPDFQALFVVLALSLALLALAIISFKRVEPALARIL
jgi:ABC-type polysaccharide/polyol phosphate export permease